MSVKKAVIAVAGLGTRFLPASKAVPKEMMPIVDKPIVQYLVEEAADSGIREVILVTRAGSHAIADHFDPSPDLERHLQEQNKQEQLESLRELAGLANVAFVRQTADLPYGNGSPLLAARPFVGDEPVVYMFGDDMVLSETPCVKQLLAVFQETGADGVVAAQNVPREETERYGILKVKPGSQPPQLESVIEKPKPQEAPSTLAQFGRFVLSPAIFDILATAELGKDNELWLADALDALARQGRVFVHEVQGKWLTTGDPLNYIKTTIQYALQDDGIGDSLAEYLRGLKL